MAPFPRGMPPLLAEPRRLDCGSNVDYCPPGHWLLSRVSRHLAFAQVLTAGTPKYPLNYANAQVETSLPLEGFTAAPLPV